MALSAASVQRHVDARVLRDVAARCAAEEALARRAIFTAMVAENATFRLDEKCIELVRLSRRSRLALNQYLSFIAWPEA